MVPGVNHAKEHCIPGPAVRPEGGGGGCRVGKTGGGEEAAVPDTGPDYRILRYGREDGLTY